MRFPVKIISILMLLTAAIAVIACTNSMTPSSDTTPTPTSTYTVTFSSQFNNIQEATKMPDPISKTVTPPATTVDALPTPPTMSGYFFGGWFTEPDGTGIQFTAGTPVTRDIIVYAYWYKYKITFISEGATVAIRMTTTPTAEELPAPPTKTGSTFAGWNTAANGTGTEFIANTPVGADITVYAQWTASTNTVRTVTYDSNGGTAVGVQYVVSPATNVGKLPAAKPTRLFYSFVEWNTAANGTGTEFIANTPVTANITVYAQWTATPGSTVTFNSEGGTAVEPQYVIPEGATVKTGTKKGSLQTPPTKPCYTFDHWDTVAGGGGDVFTENTPVTADITVYAKWTYVGFTPSYPAPSTYKIGGPGPSCVGKVFYIEAGSDSKHGIEAAPPDWYLSVDPLSTGDPLSVWIDGGYEVIEEETCEGETGDTCKSINNDRCKDGTCVLIDNIVDHVLNRKVVDYHKTQTTLNGNTKTAIGTGSANTDFIIAQSADAQAANAQAAGIDLTLLPLEKYAAKLCRDYRGGGLDKWFLPSKDELAQLYAQRDETRWGGFTEGCYWSSSEYDLYVAAWSQYFTNGTQPGSPKVVERLVRPVRAF